MWPYSSRAQNICYKYNIEILSYFLTFLLILWKKEILDNFEIKKIFFFPPSSRKSAGLVIELIDLFDGNFMAWGKKYAQREFGLTHVTAYDFT